MKARKEKGPDGKPKLSGAGDVCGTFTTYLRRKAKERNLVWDLTEEYLWNLFISQQGLCALSGVPIVLTTKRTRHNNIDRTILTASLDRKDSAVGYIEGNVQWVHKVVNVMKQSLLDKDFVAWCHLISNHANPEPSTVNDSNT